MTTAWMLGLAMLLDAGLGEPAWLWSRLPHPAVLLGRCVAWLDRVLNTGTQKTLRGVVATAMLSVGALALGFLLSQFGALVEILIAAILLAQRSLVEHVSAVADALRLSVHDGRMSVARIVSRNTEQMSEAQVARAAIESGAENLSDGVIAPAFWFLIAGLPGLLLYKAINTADSMIGYRNTKYERFGTAAARFDDLLNLIPARLTGLAIAVLGGQLSKWSAIRRDARQHRSPNAGWPEAAMARTLDLALAGPRTYDGQLRQLAWVNDGARQEIGAQEIDACVAILWRVWALALVVTFGVALFSALPLG